MSVTDDAKEIVIWYFIYLIFAKIVGHMIAVVWAFVVYKVLLYLFKTFRSNALVADLVDKAWADVENKDYTKIRDVWQTKS